MQRINFLFIFINVICFFVVIENFIMLRNLQDTPLAFVKAPMCVLFYYNESLALDLDLRNPGRSECGDGRLYQGFVQDIVEKWYDQIHEQCFIPHISFGFFDLELLGWYHRAMVEAYLQSVDKSDQSKQHYIDYWSRVSTFFDHRYPGMPFF